MLLIQLGHVYRTKFHTKTIFQSAFTWEFFLQSVDSIVRYLPTLSKLAPQACAAYAIGQSDGYMLVKPDNVH